MNLQIGMKGTYSKTITENDVYAFADLSGDYNPIHVDEIAAKNSVFGEKIAHGMLVGGLISNVIGTKMPGYGTIYLEQNLKFEKPVYIGETCTAKVVITDIVNEVKGIYRLDTRVTNQEGETVISGYAVVKYREVE